MRILFLTILTCMLASCEQLALMTTPKKQPVQSHSALASKAESTFWETLHKGEYNKIPQATYYLSAAYLENPNDPTLAAHLGFLHIWKITERNRMATVPPTITDEIILARKYFADSVALNPADARIQGFLGDSMLVEGKIFHDEKEEVRGYFQLKRAIHMWPEFNYFTGGYVMSDLDANSSEFQEGLDWQWKTLDLCAGTKINRNNPDFRPYMSLETRQGSKRACWNSWIAPHNFEGFFLNMGDMLAKAGDWQRARIIYRNAMLSKTYSSWPYRSMLEDRIVKASQHIRPARVLFRSGRGCVACHQTS